MISVIQLAIGADATQSQVPFWLQILTIAMAPILGFAGVAVGVSLSARTSRIAYLRDRRREAYSSFLAELGTLVSMFGQTAPSAFRTKDGQRIHEQNVAFTAAVQRMETARHQVALIGSRDVEEASSDAFVFLAMASTTMAKSIEGTFDRGAWNDTVSFGMQVLLRFTQSAQKDLGLPKGDMAEARSFAKYEADRETAIATVNETLRRYLEADAGGTSDASSVRD